MSSEIFLTLSEFAEDAQGRPFLLPFAFLPRIIEKIRFRRLPCHRQTTKNDGRHQWCLRRCLRLGLRRSRTAPPGSRNEDAMTMRQNRTMTRRSLLAMTGGAWLRAQRRPLQFGFSLYGMET